MSKDNKISEDLIKELEEEIKQSGAVLMYLNDKADITILSTGNLTKIQTKTAERMLAAAKPSIVLTMILFIEVAIIKLDDRVSSFISRLFKRV